MAMRVTTLQKRLPKIQGWDYVFGTGLVKIEITPHSFIIDGKTLAISGEYGDGLLDYWEGGYIHPELEAWATKMGGYWEWQNPGAIGFYFN
jgi:hypothetical protein